MPSPPRQRSSDDCRRGLRSGARGATASSRPPLRRPAAVAASRSRRACTPGRPGIERALARPRRARATDAVRLRAPRLRGARPAPLDRRKAPRGRDDEERLTADRGRRSGLPVLRRRFPDHTPSDPWGRPAFAGRPLLGAVRRTAERPDRSPGRRTRGGVRSQRHGVSPLVRFAAADAADGVHVHVQELPAAPGCSFGDGPKDVAGGGELTGDRRSPRRIRRRTSTNAIMLLPTSAGGACVARKLLFMLELSRGTIGGRSPACGRPRDMGFCPRPLQGECDRWLDKRVWLALLDRRGRWLESPVPRSS